MQCKGFSRGNGKRATFSREKECFDRPIGRSKDGQEPEARDCEDLVTRGTGHGESRRIVRKRYKLRAMISSEVARTFRRRFDGTRGLCAHRVTPASEAVQFLAPRGAHFADSLHIPLAYWIEIRSENLAEEFPADQPGRRGALGVFLTSGESRKISAAHARC